MSDAANDLPPGAEDLPPGAEPVPDSPAVVSAATDLPPGAEGLPPGAEAVPDAAPEQEEQRKDDQLNSVFDIVRQAPDNYHGILAVARETNAPVDIVAERYPEFEKLAKQAQVDPRKFRQDNPDLYFAIANDPQAAAVFMGDEKVSSFTRAARNIGKILQAGLDLTSGADDPLGISLADAAGSVGEASYTAANAPAQPPRQVARKDSPLADKTGIGNTAAMLFDMAQRQKTQIQISHLRTHGMWLDMQADAAGNSTTSEAANARRRAFDNNKSILRMQQQLGVEPEYGQNALEQLALDAVQLSTSSLPSMGINLAIRGAAAGVAGLRGGPSAAVAAFAAAGKATRVLAGAASALTSFDQEAGQAYDEFLQQKDDAGKPMEPAVARGAAVVYGLLASGVDVLELQPQFARFGPIGEAIQKGEGLGAAKAMLRDKGAAGLFKTVATNLAKSTATESVEEMVQEALQILTGYAGQSISAGQTQKLDIGEALGRIAETGQKTVTGILAGSGLVGAATHTASSLYQSAKQHAELRGAAKAAAIAELAGSPSARALPAELAKLIEETSKSDGQTVDTLHVDPARLHQVLVDQGINPEEGARQLFGDDGPQRVQAAGLQRVDADGQRNTLEVPLGVFAEKWPAEVAKAIAQDIAVRSGHKTGREILASIQQEAEVVKAEADAAPAQQGETAIRPPESIGHIAQAYQDKTVEQQARAYNTEPNTGLLNLRGMEAAPRDASRPHLAEFDLEGSKLLNDKHGHEALDGAYRAMAQSLEAAGITDAGKVGGSARAWVTDPAQAQQIAQAMQQAIDPRLKVTTASAKSVGTVKATIDESSKAHKQVKSDLGAAGELGHRQFVPAAFKHDAPAVDFEPTKNADGTKTPAPGKVLLDSPEAQAHMAKAAEALAPTAEKLKQAQPVASTVLSHEHAAEFIKNQPTAFQTIYTEPSGLLSDDGWRAARELNPKPFVVSADLRAFREMNDAFGKAGTDAINRSFGEAMAELGGGEFDAAHPHGDEYAAQGDDEAKLKQFFDDLREETNMMVFYLAHKDGSFSLQKGLSFAYGPGRTFDQADRIELPKAKAEQLDVSKPEVLRGPNAWRDGRKLLAALESQGYTVVDVQRELDRGREEASSRAGSSSESHAQQVIGRPPAFPVTPPNIADGEHLLKELRSLRLKTGILGPAPVDHLEEAAQAIVNRSTVRRLSVANMRNSEIAASNQAISAAAKGKWADAYMAKQQQTLAHFMGKQLEKAVKDRDSLQELAKKLGTDKYRERLGKAGGVYRDVVDSLLEALQFTEARTQDKPRQGLESLVRAMEDNGDTVAFDEDLVGRLLTKPRDWKSLTVDEMREVLGALKNIKKSATNRNTVIVEGRRVDRAAAVGELLSEAARSTLTKAGPPPASSIAAMSMVQRGLSIGSGLDGYLLKPQTMIEWLGNESIDSTWHKAIIKPLQQAKTREADLMRETIRPLVNAFDKIPASVRARLLESVDGAALFPGHRSDLQAPSIRLELLMMALNRGNASNTERLTVGRTISLEQVDKALSTLTKEELDWVQTVWDSAESLWPLARDLEERDSGVAPPKIPPTPFYLKLQDGSTVSMNGGYFPAVYDRRVAEVGEKQAAQTAADLMDPSYTRPGTSRSHLKKRAEEFAEAISLDPTAIQGHFLKAAHDIAFREALRSVGSLMLDPKIQAVLRQRLGDERARTFLQWLKDVGRMEAASADAHAGVLGRLLRQLKSNVVTGTLGYAIDNFIGDTTNLLVAPIKSDLKASHLASALYDFAKSPNDVRALAASKSGELRFRADHIRQEFDKQVKSLTRSQSMPARALTWYRDHGFWVAEKIDEATATLIWYGAYRQAITEGRSEADAVEFGNVVLQQTLPSHSVVDKAAIQRDKGIIGASITFYGYMNVLYNLERRIWQPAIAANGATQTTKEVAKALVPHLALVAASGILAEFLVGRGPEPSDGDDEGERWMRWFLRKLLVGSISPVPFVGGMVESWMLGKEPSVRSGPLFSTLDSIGKAALHAWRSGGDGEKAAWEAAKATGLAAGIPTRPLRAAQHLTKILTGNANDTSPAGVASGLLYGERESQGENPITAAEKAIGQ